MAGREKPKAEAMAEPTPAMVDMTPAVDPTTGRTLRAPAIPLTLSRVFEITPPSDFLTDSSPGPWNTLGLNKSKTTFVTAASEMDNPPEDTWLSRRKPLKWA